MYSSIFSIGIQTSNSSSVSGSVPACRTSLSPPSPDQSLPVMLAESRSICRRTSTTSGVSFRTISDGANPCSAAPQALVSTSVQVVDMPRVPNSEVSISFRFSADPPVSTGVGNRVVSRSRP